MKKEYTTFRGPSGYLVYEVLSKNSWYPAKTKGKDGKKAHRVYKTEAQALKAIKELET